jgi:hypothetical protein
MHHQGMQKVLVQISDAFFQKMSSPEEIYKYLAHVGTVLVIERDKIT